MRSRIPLFAILFLAGCVVAPHLASAHGIPYFGPIIEDGWNQCPLGWAAVINVINNIITFGITIASLVIAPIMIAYGGFLLVVNPFNPGAKEQAKKIILNTVIGIVVALASWLIVDAIMAVLYHPSDSTWGTWSSLVNSGGLPVCTVQAGSLNQLNISGGQTMGAGTCSGNLVCDISSDTCLPPRASCGGTTCFAGQVCGTSDPTQCVYPAGVPCGGTTCSPNYTCNSSGQCVAPPACSSSASVTGVTANGQSYVSFDPNAASSGACSASALQGLAPSLTVAQADTFACLAKYESTCGSINPNYNWNGAKDPSAPSTAYGPFQVTLSKNHAAYENSACYQAANVSGPLNCQNGFTPQGLLLNNTTESSCTTAASNLSCSFAAAIYMQQKQGWGAWTTDKNSSGQQGCINRFSSGQ